MKKTTFKQLGFIALMTIMGSCVGSNIDPNQGVSLEDQVQIVNALKNLPNASSQRSWNGKGSGQAQMISENDPVSVGSGSGSTTPINEPVEIGDPQFGDKREGSMSGVPGHWVTTTHKYRITHEYDEQILLDSHNDVIYPGSVLYSDQIIDGRYGVVLDVPVGPVTFSISAAAGTFDESEEIAHTVPSNIRISDYRKQYSKWCNIEMRPTPSIVMHSLDVVNSEFDIMSRIGANVSNEMFKLKLNFGLDFNSKKNHIFGQFLQRSFSVTTDFPKTATIFAKFVPGVFKTRPVYVSNINYGRMAFVSVETDQHLAEVQAALDFVLNKSENVKADVEIDAESKAKKLFENSKINVVLVGGGAAKQREFLTNVSIEGFRNFMASEIPVNELVPVNFQLRYVHDNSLARIITTRTYPVTTQEFIPDFDCLTVEMGVTGFILKGDVDKKNELMGTAYMIDGTEEKGQRVEGDLLNLTEWVRFVADGKTFNPYFKGSKELRIKRRKGEKPEDFLKRRITFVTDLQEKQPTHMMPYGLGVYEMSVAQLITKANSLEPSFFVTSQNKTYSAKTRFEVKGIQYMKGQIKILDGKREK